MANERWASDAAYPAGADPWSGTPTKVAPTLGSIAAGHVPGEVTPAENENWWKNRTDARLELLGGGNAVTFAAGAGTTYAELDADGGGGLDGVSVILFNASLTNLIRSLAGGVDGQEVLLVNAHDPATFTAFRLTHDDALGTAGQRFFIAGSDDFGPDPLKRSIQCDPGGVVRLRKDVALGGWRVVAMAGCRRWTRITHGAAKFVQSSAGVHSNGTASWQLETGAPNSLLWCPLELPVDFFITGYRVAIEKRTNNQAGGGNKILLALKSNNSQSAVISSYDGGTNDDGNANGYHWIEVPDGDLGTHVVPGEQFWIQVEPDGGTWSATPAQDRIYACELYGYTPIF